MEPIRNEQELQLAIQHLKQTTMAIEQYQKCLEEEKQREEQSYAQRGQSKNRLFADEPENVELDYIDEALPGEKPWNPQRAGIGSRPKLNKDEYNMLRDCFFNGAHKKALNEVKNHPFYSEDGNSIDLSRSGYGDEFFAAAARQDDGYGTNKLGNKLW